MTAGVTLGGSTLPAAAGIDPYRSPVRLWLELTRGEEREETEAMWWGTRDEAAIYERLGVLGYSLMPGATLQDRDLRWLCGHTDAHLFDDGRMPAPPVEIKSMGRVNPAVYPTQEAQLQTYIHLSGAPMGLLARRIGHTLDVQEVPRHQHAIDLLLELGEAFMGWIRKGDPPPVCGHPDDRGALIELYPDAIRDKRRRENREVREARRELVRLIASADANKARQAHCRAVITEHMGEAEVLLNRAGTIVAKWGNVQSRRFDTKAFAADHPDLYERYRVPSSTRRLDLK